MHEYDDFSFLQDYSIDLTVKINKSYYFAAQLITNSIEAKLKIFGEFKDNDQINSCKEIFNEKLSSIECSNGQYIFVLLNLSLVSYKVRSLHSHDGRFVFESEFNFHTLLIATNGANYHFKYFQSISIYSSTITQWLGVTKKQFEISKILAGSKRLVEDQSLLNEFVVELGQGTQLSMKYASRWKNILEKHQVTKFFTPYLHLRLGGSVSLEQAAHIIEQILALFFVIIGTKISIDNIYLTVKCGSKQLPFYFHDTSIFTKENIVAKPLLPYESHSPFDFNEKAFPIEIFKLFFELEDRKRILFSKFRYLKQLPDSEEKFLGLFRIAEIMTFRKYLYFQEALLEEKLEQFEKSLMTLSSKKTTTSKFIKRIRSLNQQKYNAAANITAFCKALPDSVKSELDEFIVEIESIAKLRNNITHGNHENYNQETLIKYSLFLEFLSIYSLWGSINLTTWKNSEFLIKKNLFRNIRKPIITGKETGKKIVETKKE